MPLTPSHIRSLKRKAADGSLEVEHLLKIAMLGDAADVAFLRHLKTEHGWSDTGRNRVVPLGRWADVVCCYLESGYDGLVAWVRADEKSASFPIALLEELKTPESVAALLTIGKNVLQHPAANRALALKLADAFNLVLSFKRAPRIDDATATTIRGYLHRLLGLDLSEAERATGVCALRGVGDAKSVELIASLPPFRGSWAGLERTATRQIKARLRSRPG